MISVAERMICAAERMICVAGHDLCSRTHDLGSRTHDLGSRTHDLGGICLSDQRKAHGMRLSVLGRNRSVMCKGLKVAQHVLLRWRLSFLNFFFFPFPSSLPFPSPLCLPFSLPLPALCLPPSFPFPSLLDFPLESPLPPHFSYLRAGFRRALSLRNVDASGASGESCLPGMSNLEGLIPEGNFCPSWCFWSLLYLLVLLLGYGGLYGGFCANGWRQFAC